MSGKNVEILNRRTLLALCGAVGMISLTGACTTLAAKPTPGSIHVYGPGGPAPAMKTAAEHFEQQTGTRVTIISGPLPKWEDAARLDADLVFSGSENMMTDFVRVFERQIAAFYPQPQLPPATVMSNGLLLSPTILLTLLKVQLVQQ